MQLIALVAASTLSTVISAMPALERRQVPAISKIMPNGTNAPPAVIEGSSTDPWVTWIDPAGNWFTKQVHDPTPLLNGNYVVSAIANVNICSGNWAFLYQVTSATDYPTCQGNIGAYNAGTNNQYGTVNYYNLEYGKCPSTVYHWSKYFNHWINAAYTNCWTGYWNWGQDNDDTHGTSLFPNGMRVGYCCFN